MDRNRRVAVSVFKSLGLLLIVSTGTFVGSWIYTKSGFASGWNYSHNSQMPANETAFREGEPQPVVSLLDNAGARIDLTSLQRNSGTILAFLSGTCDPCIRFAEDSREYECLNTREYSLVIVTDKPEAFEDYTDAFVYRPSGETTKNLNVMVYPTLVSIDVNGIVTSIQIGYGNKTNWTHACGP